MRGMAAGVLVLALGVLGACDASPSAEPTTPAPTPTTTPLSAYTSLSTVTVSRALFCDRVSPTAIEHAIGGPAESSTSWVNGDKTPTGERGHEYGCAWGTPDGGHASAWVFAPPITRARAAALAKASPGEQCQRLDPPQAQAFGDPSAAYSCRDDGAEPSTVLAGLFGDAWLTCDAPADAVDEFCGAILAAASATVG